MISIIGKGIYATCHFQNGRIEITRAFGNLTVQHFPTIAGNLSDMLLVAAADCTSVEVAAD